MAEIQDEYMSARKAAEYKKCLQKAVFRAIEAGRLPAIRVSRQWIIKKSDVDQWELLYHRQRKKVGRPRKPVVKAPPEIVIPRPANGQG